MKQSAFYQSLLTGAYPARAEICYCNDPDCTHEHERPKPQRDEPLELDDEDSPYWTEEEPFSDQSGDDHLRHLMNEASKLK